MRTFGVVLGAGVGARVGFDIPKQLVKVAGQTVLEHTVALMNGSPDIDELIVMVTPGWSEQVATLLGERFDKLSLILEGGATRNETTKKVLDAIEDPEGNIVLHDAVRPLLEQRIISDCVRALDTYGAVDVVIPSADTIVEVDDDEQIVNIPNRSHLRRGQTPQAFKLSVLRGAYELADLDPTFAATDDCGVVLKYLPEVPIKCVLGADQNIKITHAVDLFIADKLFQLASHNAPVRSEEELREWLGGKVIVVMGGSYGIGAEIVNQARKLGAIVVAHGRSTTGVHVQNTEEITAALAAVAQEHGQIDAVVLTAGLLKRGRLSETSDQEVAEMIDVNYLAAVNVARASYPYLRQTHGHLLFFTSSSYTRGRQSYALYSSSKAAVVNLTQALSEEWSQDGIKVNVVNPERTATPMRAAAFGKEPEGSLLSADAVAASSLDTLASEATGMVIDVRRGK